VRRSLRFRLTVAVLGVLVAVLAVFSVALHAVVAAAFRQRLDDQLASEAAAVAGMAEEDAALPAEFEYESLPAFERAVRPAYFQVWLDDDSVLARSPSLAARDLPRLPGRAAGPVFRDVALPDGRAGRAVQIRQPLRVEDAPPGRPSHGFATVVVGRGTEEVREALGTVRHWLWGLGVVVLLGAWAVAFVAVSRGLRPARSLAADIARVGEADLGRAVPTAGLPPEIEPVGRKVNELLARLAESFARERRFTADVSHELRTPLAGLRTTLEVAASRERSAPEYRAAIGEASAVVREMHALVENLLTLARLDARQVEVRRAPLRLRPFVDDCWRAHEEAARRRGLAFTNQVPDDAVAETDADKLRLVVSNLLSNAVEYTEAGGAVSVRGGPDDDGGLGAGGTLLEVHDSGPPIPGDLLPRIFDRFSRADSARSGGLHCGIGLALVRSVCEVLDLAPTVENGPDGSVRFRIAYGDGASTRINRPAGVSAT